MHTRYEALRDQVGFETAPLAPDKAVDSLLGILRDKVDEQGVLLANAQHDAIF